MGPGKSKGGEKRRHVKPFTELNTTVYCILYIFYINVLNCTVPLLYIQHVEHCTVTGWGILEHLTVLIKYNTASSGRGWQRDM